MKTIKCEECETEITVNEESWRTVTCPNCGETIIILNDEKEKLPEYIKFLMFLIILIGTSIISLSLSLIIKSLF